PAGQAVATGNVEFRDGTALLATVPPDATGKAVYTTSALANGVHATTATYIGDSDPASVTPEPVGRTVLPAAATTVVLTPTHFQVDTATPIRLNAAVAGVLPGAIEGMVSFYDGATLLGSATVSAGVAYLDLTSVPAGTHNYRAEF